MWLIKTWLLKSIHVINLCAVHIIGKYDGRIFEDRDLSFILGTGSEFGIVDGIEYGLRRMTTGETARFRVKSQLAYGVEGCPNLEIPSNADLDFQVDLKSFVKVCIEKLAFKYSCAYIYVVSKDT